MFLLLPALAGRSGHAGVSPYTCRSLLLPAKAGRSNVPQAWAWVIPCSESDCMDNEDSTFASLLIVGYKFVY